MPNDVKLKVEDLLAQVKKNLETHQEVYESALEEYHRQTTEILEKLLKASKDGKAVNRGLLVQMPVPENHADDYRRAIAMLEAETRKELKLSETEFAQLWMDEWGWKRSWANTTQNYAAANVR